MHQSKKNMFSFIQKVISQPIVGLMVVGVLAIVPASVHAQTTNTFVFNNTSVASGAGPANPANGVVSISGTNLNAGDVMVFDGIVIDVPGSAGDAWGAVELNSGGYLGLTSATLGVLVETGTASGNPCQLWVNGSSTPLGTSQGFMTNRVWIELTCTQIGSTANMNYLVEVDQGDTGTFSGMLSGTGVSFANNTITLSFGANNEAHQFIQNQPVIAVAAPTPSTNTVAVGNPATFTANLTSGWPLSTAQQWLSNGVPILNATNLAYTTPATTASYNGSQYSIIITNLLNPANVVTSAVATLMVQSAPGIVTFNFPTTTTTAGEGAVTDPGVAINGSSLLAGDTVVFDGIIAPNGSQPSDAWTAVNIAGSGYGNVTGAKLGVLCRQGADPSQLFINGSGSTNPTSSGTPTNRVRIELYPSANGSTTNMGWKVEIDQNLSGTFQPAVTGTNLTFPNNTLPLTFGSSGGSSFVNQNPESPVTVFSGPNPSQVVAVGSPISEGVTVEGWYPAFQWRKNGVAIPNATNQTYTLASAALSDNGDQFTVVVSNRVNSMNVVTSAVANVSVLIPNTLSWYPTADFTTWDTVTPNWTTNGGIGQTVFANGNNVTFDNSGNDIGGGSVNLTNTVSPNDVTIDPNSYDYYYFTGNGNVSGQNLSFNSDGTGQLFLEAPTGFSFVSATITDAILNIGNSIGSDGAFQANYITNNGTINFDNLAGVLTISGVITGSGAINQNGSATTILSATNSTCTIGQIDGGILEIASTPNPGDILNNSELQPNSSASVLVIPNAVSGTGHYAFTGFQTTILTGLSSFTGENRLAWSDVIVDNPQALGDTNSGSTAVTGADNLGGLYLSNNIIWSQPLELDPRYNTGLAATVPHISNWSGTNTVVSPLTFATGQSGSEINVEATTGLLTIDSTLANTAANNPNDLNLQGAASGIWNGALVDGPQPLNIVKRGTGVWTMGGVNTYSGTTTIADGTLLINGQIGTNTVTVQSSGELGGNGGTIAGPVSVADSGTIAPGGTGNGVLAINNNLTLAPGSFTSVNINKTAATNDRITGVNTLAYGGTLEVNNLSGTLTTNDSFQLFSAANYTGAFAAISPTTPGNGLTWNTSTLITDGTLRIDLANGVATNPTNIMATLVGGNTLQLNWPTDHIGWTLEAQTNSLNVGLSTNWVRISTSTTTNQISAPIVTGNGCVFYRLVYP
jgi:autotransporter-associated beta strand protein